ncbi:hypothetical protein NM688_g7751 [Phlebia brevispora]|uniref:Uncharacterized protein n=1 Tax=Phlebia brevispora TaxID=194682 RepID=A0ACC1S1N1_9APHY|nr:hypothetical protein NM688_g7751 [Phlebia brevispora]
MTIPESGGHPGFDFAKIRRAQGDHVITSHMDRSQADSDLLVSNLVGRVWRDAHLPRRSSADLCSQSRMSNPYVNTPVPDADQYYPLNDPSIGKPLPAKPYPQNAKIPLLFQPLTLKGVTFKNRIWASPMCQYSSDNGHATDWHLVHIGGFATRGVGAICLEATAVVPEGRISPQDAGLWTDTQMEPLKRIVNFCHAQGTLVGVQLAHAGRKASTYAPWVHLNAAKTQRAPTWVAGKDEDGWPDNGTPTLS